MFDEAKTLIGNNWEKLDTRTPAEASRTDWPAGRGEVSIEPPRPTVEQRAADFEKNMVPKIMNGLPPTLTPAPQIASPVKAAGRHR